MNKNQKIQIGKSGVHRFRLKKNRRIAEIYGVDAMFSRKIVLE